MTPHRCPWLPYESAARRAEMRLFCFPYAGGSAAMFHDWQPFLPDGVEVLPVELPGRGHRFREPPLRRIGDVVDGAAIGLRSYLDRPYALFGHSMGALIAFELARRLMSSGAQPPVHLFLSARRAPHVRSQRDPWHDLPHDAFVEELRRLKGTPAEILDNAEALELLLPVIRADFEMVQTYAIADGPVLRCPLTVYGGISDHDTPPAVLEPWREYTRGPFALTMCSGDHFFVTRARADLLAHVSAEIESLCARRRFGLLA